jgi:polo-like kinase 1
MTPVGSNELFAAKVIDKATLQKDKTKAKLSTEIKIHSAMSHKNIVKFHRFFEDSRYVYILLEVCRCRVCLIQLSLTYYSHSWK